MVRRGENHMDKRVVTVVVTYNRKSLLEECLSSLMSQTYQNHTILVVDNCSTDGTYEMLQDFIRDKKIVYFNTGENKGGSYGFHIGSKLAVQLGCDYIWLMDDDCIPTRDALEKLMAAADGHPDFGYLSSKVLWTDGNMCQMNIPKKDIGKHISEYDKEQNICIASFVSCFIREQVVEDVGLSMKDFFIWGDDWEYTLRISKKYKSYYIPDSVVIHKSKTNFGVNIAKADKSMLPRYRYAYRNESYFYHQGGLYGRVYLFLKVILHTFRVLFSKCDSKSTRLKYIYIYTREGKRFRPTIVYAYPKDKPLNILEITSDPIQYGGQEMFIMNMYRNFENLNNHITIATPFNNENKEIHTLMKEGDEVMERKCNSSSRFFKKREMMKGVKSILKSKKFDVIHIHSGSIYALLNISKAAKKAGVKTIIVHSHLGGENNWKYRLIKRTSDKRIDKYATIYLACSDLAAQWKFPKHIIDEKKYTIINNGIDIRKFTFDENIRSKIRQENGIEDQFTMIHVGRFAKEKNHEFFLSILPELEKKVSDFRFICIGLGEEKTNFIKGLETLGLKDKFIFKEGIDNVNEYLFAADCFLLPSLHEGFPIALIEAEATGLSCAYSELVTKEALLTDRTKQIPLSNKNEWIEFIDSVNENNRALLDKRADYALKMKTFGYDEKDSAHLLESIYRGE